MTLNDLENTMVVKLRNGGLYVVLTDPKYLQSIWSRNAPEPIDETIKELDEFGSKEVTFY